MTLEDLGNVGELIGAIATVATLAYLAVQIRRNTKTVRTAAVQAIADAAQQRMLVLTDREIAHIMRKVRDDGQQLDEEELLRYRAYLRAIFRGLESQHYQYRSGNLDEENWLGWQRTVPRLLDSPDSRRWWQAERDTFASSFQAMIESSIRVD